MTDEQKISVLKTLVDDSEVTEEVLSAYLLIAGNIVIQRAYPYRDDVTEVPAKYASIQVEIASYLIAKRGAEGQTAHSENGISRSYENGEVPESLLRRIVPYCGIPGE